MPKLDPGERARLPESAFAYIDSRGRRRLPIHDQAHVRNALARFNQVSFESEAARERARKRLLKAAKKFGIVPIGFITGQIELAQKRAAAVQGVLGATHAASLPSGFVTFLMTDIERSTELLHHLGDRYGELLNDVRRVLRSAVSQSSGREIDARGDEFFAIFESASQAIESATAAQRALRDHSWPDDLQVRVRAGIHSGRTKLTDVGYIGIAVHAVARVCSAAHGGQILVSGDTFAAVNESGAGGLHFRNLGKHRLAGLPDPEALYQVEADGLLTEFPPPRTAAP